MNPDQIFIYVNDRRTSLAAFMTMEQAAIKTVDARGCTGLTKLDAPKADYVDARGCTGLTKLDAPEAITEYDKGLRSKWTILGHGRRGGLGYGVIGLVVQKYPGASEGMTLCGLDGYCEERTS